MQFVSDLKECLFRILKESPSSNETFEMIDRARAEDARNHAQKLLEEKGTVSIDDERGRLALLRALNRLGAADVN